jgi:hypothetical protein
MVRGAAVQIFRVHRSLQVLVSLVWHGSYIKHAQVGHGCNWPVATAASKVDCGVSIYKRCAPHVLITLST